MEPKPDPIHRRERDHADGIEAAHGSGRIKPPAMLADLSFQDHRDRVVTQLAKHNSDSSGQPPEMPSWARDKWNLRALGSLPVEPVQTRAPVMALYGFGFKNEDLSESRAFYNFLESQPVTPDRLYEALKFYPAQEEVLGIAAGLLQRSPTDRALGLSLMKELCRSDRDPASPIVISRTGGLIRWLLDAYPMPNATQ
jgi:hypothetical protein